MITNGVRMVMRILTGLEKNIAIFSAYCVANDFGVISPKTMMTTDRIEVAIPVALMPYFSMAMTVAREEAEIFTILLPMSRALMSLEGFSTSFRALFALLCPSSAKCLNLSRLAAVNAVSAEEKKADKITRITNKIICHELGSKKINS